MAEIKKEIKQLINANKAVAKRETKKFERLKVKAQLASRTRKQALDVIKELEQELKKIEPVKRGRKPPSSLDNY